ncbi:MAG TPA: hypothetical protein VG963_33100, partial [Polyangiaceae bacterium]|nr:hypothetical protein [Polyangiaceae bacterium]
HPDCGVFNVFNAFDLTQRVVADFSLYQLNGALRLVGVKGILDKLHELHFDPAWFEALKKTELVDQDPSWFGLDPALLMPATEARALYAGTLELLTKLEQLLAVMVDVVDKLERGVTFPLARQLADKVCAGRQVLSAPLAARFRLQLEQLRTGIDPTLRAFQARLARGVFPLMGLIDDVRLNAFLRPLVQFVDIDAQSLEGPLWRLVHDLLIEQIEEFDDTVTSPEQQLAASPFGSNVLQFDVTQKDRYGDHEARPHSFNYPGFVAHLEAQERSYAVQRDYRSLMEIVFTLLAQVGSVRELVVKYEPQIAQLQTYIPWRERLLSWIDQPAVRLFIDLVSRLLNALVTYTEIVRTRNADLVVPIETLPPEKPDDPPYGDLNYLMRVSHSISRRWLDDHLRDALERSMLPAKRR